MSINQILAIAIIIGSVTLVILVLMQQPGGGIGTLFSGTGGETYRTRRGAEKFIFYATIAVAVVWVGLLLSNLFLSA